MNKSRKQIEISDLMIAATAIYYQLPLATFNTKHFINVPNLILIENSDYLLMN